MDIMDIRLEMAKMIDLAFLNVRSPTTNRFWDRWNNLRLILADRLDDYGSMEAQAARAEWRLDQRRYATANRGRFIAWLAQTHDEADAKPFLPPKKVVTKSFIAGPARMHMAVQGGTFDLGVGEVTIEQTNTPPKRTILNADWFLHFSPGTLKLIGWSNNHKDRRVMLFTHSKLRRVHSATMDTDVSAGGFVSLFNPQGMCG